jgi:hypothetical protein
MGGWAVEVKVQGAEPSRTERGRSIIESLRGAGGEVENATEGTWRVAYDNDSLEDAVVHLRYDLGTIDAGWRECLAIVNRDPAAARLPDAS